MHNLRFLCFASLLAILGTAAHAQWTVINLHPAGATSSRAFGVGGGKQVGFAVVGAVKRASLWSGSAASWTDLHPATGTDSEARSTDGVTQGGWVTLDGTVRGAVWSGTAVSAVDLTPYAAGATRSAAYSVRGGQQVGTVWFGDINYASTWNSDANTWVNLNPEGAASSRAYGTDGVQQVGNANVDGIGRASLWYGDSWVDLHPAAAGATWSSATAVNDNQQVGYFFVGTPGGSPSNACLWSGTSASFVNLHPAWSPGRSSEALGVAGNQQVGYHDFHASLWNGTAASMVDLHPLLPKNTYSMSFAHGIAHDARYTYVVGWGYNTKTKRDEALMWRKRR